MKITKLHRDVAEALVTQRATPADVRARFRIKGKTLARWQAEPVFQGLVAEVERRHRQHARWLFVTYAPLAAARLVKLTEAASDETARKACLDVLEQAEVGKTPPAAQQPAAPETDALDADTRRRIYELLAAAPAPPARRPAQVAPAAESAALDESGPAAGPERRGAFVPTALQPAALAIAAAPGAGGPMC